MRVNFFALSVATLSRTSTVAPGVGFIRNRQNALVATTNPPHISILFTSANCVGPTLLFFINHVQNCRRKSKSRFVHIALSSSVLVQICSLSPGLENFVVITVTGHKKAIGSAATCAVFRFVQVVLAHSSRIMKIAWSTLNISVTSIPWTSFSKFPQQQTLHPFHPHPGHFLSLSDIYKNSILDCEACLSMTNYFVYDCVKCEFCLHPQCASLLPNVKYKGHEHLLILVENMSYKGECEACRGNIEGTFFFRCVQCRLNFHVQCGSVPASLPPTVVHKNHDHPLTLTAYVKYYVESLKCYACSEEINPKDPCYLCVECEYYAHVRCAVITEIFCDDDREVLGHTSHDDCSFLLENKNDDELGHSIHCHTLTLSEVDDVKCKLCCKHIHGSGYGCAPCEFYIHNSCAELPKELRHPLHPLPNHSLTLQESKFLEGYYCDACDLNVNPGGCYRCDYCDFALHLECAYLKPSVKYEGHEHLLILVENMSYQGICEACGFEIEGTFFVRCVQCCFNLHVQCGPAPASLPPTVVHKHGHDHPLSISTKAVAKNDSDVLCCDACGEERNPKHPYYCCVECEYNAHVRCVLTEVSHDERVKLRHFSHDHCLYFAFESKRNDGVTCYACERLIQADDPAYGCDPCGFYLHKSCTELPWQPQHLLHRHPLYVSTDHSKTDRVCSACHKNVSGFIYECNRCDFTLDIDCFSLQFRVELQGDEQIFTFFEKLDHSSKCQSYNFMHLDVSNQRCLKCNFNIHLLHSPLPQTIQHMSHHHLLTLMDSLVDDEYDAQICDICEEERHPKACVYYCSECDFIAEFDCVISEVRLALQKKPRDVQFRFINRKSIIHESTAGEVVNSKSSTLGDIEESLTEEEAQQFNDILQDVDKEVEESREKFSIDQQLMAVDSSKEDTKSLMESQKAVSLYFMKDLFEWEDYRSELINVNDIYKTSPRLAGVLRKLLDKYGDIGSSCNLNQGLKNCVLVLFCATVHSMCDTMVQDITDDLIYTWWRDSRIAQRAGFRVGFVFDHLERIAEARHGIDTELYQISPIRYQYKKMSKLLGEIDQLDQDIGERKAKVDEFRKQAQEMISTIHPKRLRLETEELSKAMDIGIVKAGKYTGLL
ncbi:cysteine/Histidine-rich C1 domain family protein [Citrus sinensis]|nr:cysteine/Histidine-rich C1 domain family protein [Citrus sinensis]